MIRSWACRPSGSGPTPRSISPSPSPGPSPPAAHGPAGTGSAPGCTRSSWPTTCSSSLWPSRPTPSRPGAHAGPPTRSGPVSSTGRRSGTSPGGALRAVEAHVGRPLPTRLVLTKRIPTGAGLGGGSADAGATLLAVNQAWGLGLGVDVLQTLGATLGSDVPFFVDTPGTGSDAPGPAVVGGFGEAIERTLRAAGELVLMVPAFGCATGSVYRAFDEAVAAGHGGTLKAERIETLARRGTVDPSAALE
ncbi:MAG: hypothetical protein HND58_00740 [Planctomycetota bacterium]|nr:MAG: hypothetical protein HND58_00740 [Planctomycetota bacterium]